MNTRLFNTAFIFVIIFLSLNSFAQEEPVKKIFHFNGDISITNNGFSFIPTFSLGKPATIADLSVGGKKFSFDPQFRFDLDGLKPWSFIFIWRYKVIQTEKLQVKADLHLPAISFLRQKVTNNGTTYEQIFTQRWCTPELTISYKVSEKISVGTYYIHGIGLEKEGQTKQTDFTSLRMRLSNVKVVGNIYFQWDPQLYFIRMDDLSGFFAAQNLTLSHKKLPISIASMMNISMEANNEIPTEDFVWNVSLIYSFRNEFTKKQ